MNTFTILPLALVCLLGRDDGPDASTARVDVVELTVRRKIEGQRIFGQEGVELRVITKVQGKQFFSLDKSASKLVKFTDDAGTNLAAGADKGFFFWASLDNFGEERATDTVSLRIRTKSLPSKKAGRLHLKANVALLSASGSKTKSVTVKAAKGSKFTVAGYAFEIQECGPAQWGNCKFKLGFQTTKNVDAIQKVTFVGANGKAIKTQDLGTSSYSGGKGTTTYIRSFGFPSKLDKVTIQLTVRDKVERVIVPLDLDIGAGL